ncbi:MAG: RICIN domain-containing protein [Collinsella sp.]
MDCRQAVNGTYLIESALRPGLYLGSRGSGASNGVNVELSSNEGASQFALLGTSLSVAKCDDILPKGYFTLSPACSSTGKVIDVAGGSSSNGANVQLYSSNGTLAQLFSFEYYDGYYVIRNAKSQKAFDVDSGNLIPGTNVQQWACDSDNANRLFAAIDNGDGTYSFVNKSTGLALDIAGASDSAQANLDAYLPNGTAAQKFSLHRVSEFLDEGAYSFESDTSSKVLDVSGGSGDGAAVQLYASNGTLAQKWYVSKVAGLDNEYEIKCIGSGKVLSLTDGDSWSS